MYAVRELSKTMEKPAAIHLKDVRELDLAMCSIFEW